MDHSRQQQLDGLSQPWDVIVIGGGINGAGVFRLAASQGLRVLLLEQRDFGWGTSSRSGKLVHGGLRYLLQGQPRTTWHSVHEREKLLRGYGGLVEGLGFLFPLSHRLRLAKPMVHLVLSGYELMAGRWDYKFHRLARFAMLAPRVNQNRLCGGFSFMDATADDARLVYRVLQEGEALGGVALNYLAVRALRKTQDGPVRGVEAVDELTGREYRLEARVVINASGAWTDDLRSHLGRRARLRRLRGSHLILPRWRLPLGQAVGIRHPSDGRAMYIMPWEGATLVGTTDLDHHGDMGDEPCISPAEGAYLLEAVDHWFPSQHIDARDVLATFSGVRPVIDTGKKDPSKEARDHAVWSEDGMVTLTGGKLTTFSLVAGQGLAAAARWLRLSAGSERRRGDGPAAWEPSGLGGGEPTHGQARRLSGRYGALAPEFARQAAENGGLEAVADTEFTWAELAWAASREKAQRLEDIMLRRTRLGLLLPQGGAELMERVRAVIQPAAGWSDGRWLRECEAYLATWRRAYSPDLLTC